MSSENQITHGSCLCGSVRFYITGPLRDVVNCHCQMCQKHTGGFGPHTKAKKGNIHITSNKGLTWYKTSEIAQRGFCNQCGSSLFWEPFNQDSTGILAGALDGKTGLKTIGPIFVGEKPDYYEISDTCPQFQESSDGQLAGDYK